MDFNLSSQAFPSEVSKRKNHTADIEGAVGTAGLTGFFGRYAIEDQWNKGVEHVAQSKTEHAQKRIAQIKTPGTKRYVPKTKPASRTMGEYMRKAQRTPRQAAVAGQYRKIKAAENLRAHAKVHFGAKYAPPLAFGSAALLYHGARQKVKKDIRRRDVDAAAVGSGGSLGAYHGVSYALKPLDRKAERKIANDDVLREKARSYRKAAGLPKNAKAGDQRWINYFRNYPKDLPGARQKRILSRTHAGGSGALAAGTVAAVGGYGALRYSQKHRVSKMMPDQSAVHVLGPMKKKRKGTLRKVTIPVMTFGF